MKKSVMWLIISIFLTVLALTAVYFNRDVITVSVSEWSFKLEGSFFLPIVLVNAWTIREFYNNRKLEKGAQNDR